MSVASRIKRNVSIVTKYTTVPLLLFSITPTLGYLAGGGVWYWLTVFVLLLSIALDPIVGTDPINAPIEMDAELTNKLFFRVMLWLYVPMQFLMTLFCYSLISETSMGVFLAMGVTYVPLGWGEIIGLALSLSLVTGFGATIGHELCHHCNRIDHFLGQVLLTPISMADVVIGHVWLGDDSIVYSAMFFPKNVIGDGRFCRTLWFDEEKAR